MAMSHVVHKDLLTVRHSHEFGNDGFKIAGFIMRLRCPRSVSQAGISVIDPPFNPGLTRVHYPAAPQRLLGRQAQVAWKLSTD